MLTGIKTQYQGMECLPEELKGRAFYQPTGRGLEQRLAERIEEIKRIRAERAKAE